MFRFFYVILTNILRLLYFIPAARWRADRPARYSKQARFEFAKDIVYLMQRSGRITTVGHDLQNVPAKKGYFFYPNHQGKFDAPAIVYTQEVPVSLVMDEARSHMPLVAQCVDLLEGKRLVLNDPRQGLQISKEMIRECVEDKKNFIIFPEGGYNNNHNAVMPFKPGAFRAAVKAKAPICPVAIIDSWKAFGAPGFAPVTVHVYYLPPLYYEDYKDMSTGEIADKVRKMIQDKILSELTGKELDDAKKFLAQQEENFILS